MKIPLIHIKDKQAFIKEGGILRFLGKPIDIAKEFKEEGYKLIHIIDEDALKGLSKNFDIYDALTFFINVQVECAPKRSMINKFLSMRCRVVLPHNADFSGYKERNLLVARLPKDHTEPFKGFHDAIIEEERQIAPLLKAGKRIMVHLSVYQNLSEENRKHIWGIIEGE
jgi:hypothetical protein